MKILYLIILTFFFTSYLSAQLAQPNEAAINTHLVNSQHGETEIILKVNHFSSKKEIIAQKHYSHLVCKGAYPTLEKGAPEVLKYSEAIIIGDTVNTKIEIINSNFTDYPNYYLAPSKGNLTRDINPQNVPYEFSANYTSNKFYPGKIAELSSPYILRDYRGQSIIFYPFQYNPVTHILRVYHSVRIKVSETAGVSQNIFHRKVTKSIYDDEFSSIYQSQFINFKPVKYTPLAENGPMLIIANQAYMSAMHDFISWKIRSGRNVKMVSIQSIGNSSTAIKNYIQNEYDSTGISFVLLVGDAQHITPYNSSSAASDNYYGYLAGNDSYSELIVGRFSAESVADVQTQVARTLNYELNIDTNATQMPKSIGIASNQGPGDDNEYDYQHIQGLQSQLSTYTYNSHYQFFDGTQGGNDAAGNPTATMVSGAINDGSGIILYTGHGSNSSFGTSGFSSSNISALSNVNKLPFIWSVACVNGEFVGNTCFAEYWLRSQNNGNPIGAVATLMSTINQSWNPPMEGMDAMVELLIETDSTNIKRTFGALSINGCMQMNDTYGTAGASMTDTWTIFGDPSIMVRTNTPSLLAVSHSNTLLLGTSSMSVTVNTNGALVCLSKNDTIIAKSIVINNLANLNFNNLTNLDSVDLVVIAYNKIPYVTKIPVIPGSLPLINQLNFSVNDSLSNNSHSLEYGENSFLSLSLTNHGLVNAQGVSATISSNSPLLTFSDSLENFGTILSNDTLNANTAFSVSASQAIIDQTQIPISLNITDLNNNNWNYNLSLTINAPALAVSVTSQHEIGGNGNGTPDPGESIQLKFKVLNQGHANLDSIFGSLMCNSPYLSFSVNYQSFGLLTTNNDVEFSFTALISVNCPIGTSLDFNFLAQRNFYFVSQTKTLRVGIAEENFDTGDFTKYNWQSAGNYPWIIDFNQFYDGNSSAKSGLSATDHNKTSSMFLDLKVQQADSISFYLKVSCEDGGNTFYDYLEFSTNNISQKRWKGEVDWKRESFALDTGAQTVRWTYSKSSYDSEGSDCAWIDYIIFPPLMDETSVGEQSNKLYFSLFPNPSSDQIIVEFELSKSEAISIQITDAQGKIVAGFEEASFANGKHRVKIAINSLNAGVYNVQVNEKSSNWSRKVIKL